MLSNLIGGSVGLSHLVRETACITTVTLALLESIADTTAGATRSITSRTVVREAASITTVTFTTLESIADTSGTTRSSTEVVVITVRETATTTTVTLTLLEGIACTRSSAVGGEVGESIVVTVRETAAAATVTLATLESIAHASGLALISTAETTVICASHIVGEAASITTVALTLLESIAHVSTTSSRHEARSIPTLGRVRKTARIASSALTSLKLITNTRHFT